jgi:hypothetical protein
LGPRDSGWKIPGATAAAGSHGCRVFHRPVTLHGRSNRLVCWTSSSLARLGRVGSSGRTDAVDRGQLGHAVYFGTTALGANQHSDARRGAIRDRYGMITSTMLPLRKYLISGPFEATHYDAYIIEGLPY